MHARDALSASLAAGILLVAVAAAVLLRPALAIADLRAGEFCSTSKEAYYEQHGYTCRRAPDGRNRLYTYEGGSGSGGSSRLKLGRTVYFGHVNWRHVHADGCRLVDHRRLPDRQCSPGGRYKLATERTICRAGYASSVRHVTDATKEAVYRAYRVRHHSASTFEMDHIVPLELGGSNARGNLFPEPAPGFHRKDRLENRLHALVCDGQLGLRKAQRMIASNWLRAYRRVF